jgi:hypothetical protein
MQSSNGHGVHNGSLIQGAKRSQIIELLAQGESANFIAKRLHHSRSTIHAIRDEEWSRVEQRKTRLAAQWERAATSAVDQLNDHLDTSNLPPNILVPIAGVATDKLLALRGEASLYIQHEHFHRSITKQDLLSFALARSKTIQGKVVSAPALTNALPVPSSGPTGSGSVMASRAER